VDGAKTVKVSRRSFEEYPNSETTRRSSGSKKPPRAAATRTQRQSFACTKRGGRHAKLMTSEIKRVTDHEFKGDEH